MSNNTSVSQANSYQSIGAFWDEHDATEAGEQTEVQVTVNIQSQHCYFALDNQLALKTRKIAKQHGICEETLLNLWIQEKINELAV